jgi:mRNA interferase RelE/StbE
MAYELRFTKKAERQLRSLDRSDASNIVRWLDKNVQGCEDPRSHGRSLTGNRAGYWRYRIGKYRVICIINDDELIILAVTVGKRDGVYE